MKLIVPHLGDLHPADARLLRLAGFLGAHSESLPLEAGALFCANLIDQRVGNADSCLVINPTVLSAFFPDNAFPLSLASSLLKHFSFLLIHNLRQDPFSASTVLALSDGLLRSVIPIQTADLTYCCAPSTDEICAQFSGVQFGPTHPANDQVFVQSSGGNCLRNLITIDDRPFFATTQSEKATVFFLGGTEIADIDALWNGKSLTESFSGLLPPAMALRSIFGSECWCPNRNYATLLIDDPLLRQNYGFLNYQRALRLMDKHDFHTTIAFIPHNFRRTSRTIARMFRERTDRYSICFHGNDHTNAEFAAKDANLVNTMLTVAKARMTNHESTGIQCDNVMVFPQGNFSRSAMEALNAQNFSAAVNTVPYPLGEALKLTISDVIQPAVLKYAGFPLFLRKYVRQISPPEIAFNTFFGRPLFIAEHHTIFKDPEPLIELVARVHSIAPDIQWASVGKAIENSWLKRYAEDGAVQVRSFSNVARVENPSNLRLSCSIEWPDRNQSFVEKVLADDVVCNGTRVEPAYVRSDSELAPGESRLFSLVHRNSLGISDAHNGPQWAAKAFLRRRLSEIRDNYLSKNEQLLSLAKFLQRRVFHKGAGPEEALGT